MVERISPREAKRRMDEEGYAYLDVRTVHEFEQGHPDGAYNVPLQHMGPAGMEPNPSFLEVVSRVFTREGKIVVGCRSGHRSLRAAELLLEAGFEHVVDQRAGYGGARGTFGEVREPGWKGEGLPTATESATGRSWVELR